MDTKKTDNRGGARPGAGRNRLFREPLSRTNVGLDTFTINRLGEFGQDQDSGKPNLSEGIRKAARALPDAATIKILEAYGDGDLAEGIRKAAALIK